ncbi:hypothetical protein EW146_g5057 [Bondarzewia mesenterica]|uniref:Uncharacterized protein n=1 Tax=Bondarzewia mesenterica TaxID=1095465 RepID=A0A4S4LSL5_9AGAM|nr:hypothetical protein EW146_g5057 [Bondarzewia mesenterica]
MSRLREHNDVLLTKQTLLTVLHDLSSRLLASFGHQVRLIVHGGAVMVLHSLLHNRKSTRDVDYIHRAFASEYRRYGTRDAEARLKSCIAATAYAHGLGADWMNAHADVALPMARDAYGRSYDPIHYAAVTEVNLQNNTIFSAPGLLLVSVSWPWAVALKFVRYQKDDPVDIAAMLRLGHHQAKVRWSRAILEEWVTRWCWPMGYSSYPPPHLESLRQRMRHAIGLAYGQIRA